MLMSVDEDDVDRFRDYLVLVLYMAGTYCKKGICHRACIQLFFCDL